MVLEEQKRSLCVTSSFEAMKSRLPSFSLRWLKDGHGYRTFLPPEGAARPSDSVGPLACSSGFPCTCCYQSQILDGCGDDALTCSSRFPPNLPPTCSVPDSWPVQTDSLGFYYFDFWWSLVNRRPQQASCEQGTERSDAPAPVRGSL